MNDNEKKLKPDLTIVETVTVTGPLKVRVLKKIKFLKKKYRVKIFAQFKEVPIKWVNKPMILHKQWIYNLR